ncbi:hypothetical protein [Ligilactobacillus equi]|uniref:Uncharacterized protein n=2 Tax=Ligilactobacillus equi TaxID=137357 RepID=V7HXE7_9LACO|nr:hypothetical protein [Ligilactobacillus equi]ETA74567.1 hypothetical protein LEQ_0432c [Ligilactobacillus equi DPC 6820]KRL84350.1 hypothetical protein FC36_GL000273 [Ligilactobacillus equi DSM 15833 = JCM 10991]
METNFKDKKFIAKVAAGVVVICAIGFGGYKYYQHQTVPAYRMPGRAYQVKYNKENSQLNSLAKGDDSFYVVLDKNSDRLLVSDSKKDVKKATTSEQSFDRQYKKVTIGGKITYKFDGDDLGVSLTTNKNGNTYSVKDFIKFQDIKFKGDNVKTKLSISFLGMEAKEKNISVKEIK